MFAEKAQSIIFSTYIDETALEFRVKQIDEFMQRFNYETDYKGDAPANPNDKADRKKNMLTLFNLDKFSKQNNEIDSVAESFLDYIIDNNITLHYEDTTWYAKAKCSLTYEGRQHDAILTLKTERVKDVIFKWVIVDISSPLFKQFPTEMKDSVTISPAEHGISFITIPGTLNLNKSSVGSTFANGYYRSNLCVFDFLMATGKLKVNIIKQVTFHFKLPEAEFDVELIEKEKSYNQGWLINNLNYRKETHHEK